MCQCKLCVLCVVLCFCVYAVTTFNVDSYNYALYEGRTFDGRDPMFGFSMALHREGNRGWLIVGAPEAQSTIQRTVAFGGAVYRCPTDRDGDCEEIGFDTKGDNYDGRKQMDNKTEQWFGATVSSSGREEGPIVACAPRYTWFPIDKKRRDPVGTCYVSNGLFREFNEYSPCRTYQWGYHRQGSCQAGFSAAINSAGDRLFIGSPGSWYWQGQVHQQSLETRPAVFSTTEGTEKDDDSYMGYSTIVGDFLGNGEEGIAVGMPRGNNLRGKVLLFTWNLTNFLHHFTSDQIGSYYGYALAASDVDGDGKLDLIIGAPMYTVQNNKEEYDVGRVYVIYHQSGKGKFEESYVIDGFKSRSRFGQALASLGDINQDGYGDFAVGAPYDGKGAVYIYHGSAKGVRKKYSQVILAEDIVPQPSRAPQTFGFSLTGGLDLDGNQYPDMAVGAYLSNKAFFFRSRPVIRVAASVKFLTSHKTVDIRKPDYYLSDGTGAVKTQIQFCSNYSGKGIPASLNLGVEYILDTKKLINSRMGFVDDENQNRKNTTITLYRGVEIKCADPVDVYVRSDIRDKLTSLVVEAKYWMRDDADLAPAYLQQLPRDPRSILTPVLDLNSPPSKKDTIIIFKNCGDDDVCIPDLNLKVYPSVRQYSLDSGENLYLNVEVSNTGEDAFEAVLEVKYPDGLFYGTSTDDQVESHVLCSASENSTIKCDIGNPIPQDKLVRFKLSWQPDYSKELPPKLTFQVSVNSTNGEPPETQSDNRQTVGVSIFYNVIQEIRGWSVPNDVLFNPATSLFAADISNQTHLSKPEDRLSEEVIGPQVIHVYELKNGGKTTIKATEIYFVWPATTASGEDFLYLVDPPHFSFTKNLNLKCGPIPANYRDFEVPSRKKSIWELYLKDVTTESSSDKGETSHRVGVIQGGTIVKGDKKIDEAVGGSGDSSLVMKHRQNKTHEQISRVQIFEAGEDVQLGESFRHLQIAKRDYAYRCFKSTNGREQEVDCGTNFSFSGVNIPSLLQQANSYYQEEGDIRYFCLESDSTGNWQKVECGAIPKIPVNTFVEEKEVTVQIFPGGENMVKQLESGKYHQQQIGGQSFIYRCFRKTGGREQEVDCSNRLSLSKVDVSKFLEQAGQQEGQIRYTCLEPDSGGNLRSVQCDNVPKIKFKTEIVRYSWGSNDTHYWNDSGVYRTAQGQDFKTIQVFPGGEEVRRQLQGQGFQYQQINGKDYVYRCFRRIDGRQEEIDCGENFSFSSVDIPWLLERANVQQDGQIRYTCLEPDEKGNLRSGNCGSVPKIQFKSEIKKYFWGSNDTHYWNNTGVYRTGQRRHFTTVQVFPGGEEVRRQLQGQGYHYQQINGKEYVYRCFRRIDGRQEEIDCGDNFSFSSVNIPWLLERANVQQDGHIRYTCLEPDEEGNLRSGNCGSVPKIQFKTEVRKYFWGSNDTHYWNNTGVYRTSRREGVTVQIFPGSESLRRLLEGRGYHYREINGREYIYRCFRRTGGREEEVDCGDSFSFSTVNIPLLLERTGVHQDGNIRYTCLETDLAGNLMTRDCVGVPKIHFKTDVTFWQSNGTHYWNSTGVYRTSTQYDFSIVQIFESGEDTTHFIGRYRFETINNRNYFYRCFKNRQQVDCGASFSLAGINLVELLRRVAIRYEGRIQYFCLDMDSTGNWRNADCSGLPKIELAGQRPPVQPDILQRCLTLVDNKWQEVDCASEVRFQTDRTFVRECFQTVNGQRTRIDCDNVPQGALTGGSRYQGGTQSNVNYNPAYGGGYGYNNQSYIYDESEYVDENEDTYANPEPGLTPRDPKTYGTYDRSRQGSVDGLGGAAQGKGFTTVALDLGNLNPNLGGNYHGAGESHWSETRQVPPVYNNIERDNVPTAAPTSKNWHHGRRKRQIIGDTHPSIGDIRKEFPCTNLACVYMRCTIENLEYNKPLTIALRGRLNAKVLREMKLDNAMEFSSMMVARVHKVPHLMSLEDSQFVSQEVKTVVKTPEEIKSETVPLWVVVLSAVAGTIILLLIIFLMYKFGFFRRNRPYSAPERQPLRNGYPADEAL